MLQLNWISFIFTVINILVWILIIFAVIYYHKKIVKWIKKVNEHIDGDK